MKRYIRSSTSAYSYDVNSYSYTGKNFFDDTLLLCRYVSRKPSDDGTRPEVLLVQDGDNCEVVVKDGLGEILYHRIYPMSQLGMAICDFNKKAMGYGKTNAAYAEVDRVLSNFGKSIDDYR